MRLPDHRLVTSRVLRDFERQQGKGLAEPLLDELMRRLSTIVLPERWAAEFAPGRRSTEARIADEMMAVLGLGWREGENEDGALRVGEGDGLTDQIPESLIPILAARFGLPAFHAARATAVRLVKWTNQQAVDPDQRREIAEMRARLEEAFDPPETWNAQQDRIRSLVESAVTSAQGATDTTLLQLAHSLADTRRAELLIGVSASPMLATGWLGIATVVADLVETLRATTSTTARPSRLDMRDALQPYLDYFDGSAEPIRVCDRLLNLVIAERALHPAEPNVDQPVEFIQVSANTRTLLAPSEQSVPASQQLDCVDKLHGVEFHHFAAFYKSSWRAYDWMWGRLDGAGWLVHILLDPRRILAVVENDPGVSPHGGRAKQFANRLRTELGLPIGLPDDCLEADLGFLDIPGAQLPDSLPNSALFLAAAWQRIIAANELPVVAERILADSGRLQPLTDPHIHEPAKAGRMAHTTARLRDMWYRTARKRRQGRRQSEPPNLWATKIVNLSRDNAVPLEVYAHELPDCPVRWETVASQMHTAAFARTATKATAVSTAALEHGARDANDAPIDSGRRSVHHPNRIPGDESHRWQRMEDLACWLRPRRRRHRPGHPKRGCGRCDRHHHRPRRAVSDRPGCLGHSPGPARGRNRDNRVRSGRITGPRLGAPGAMGLECDKRRGAGARPPVAAGQLVGRACHRRRPAPDRRAYQPRDQTATHQPARQQAARPNRCFGGARPLNRIAYEDDHYAETTMTVREQAGCHWSCQQGPRS